MNLKRTTKRYYWVALFQSINYRKPFIASDIKKAVAFFKISSPAQAFLFSFQARAACVVQE